MNQQPKRAHGVRWGWLAILLSFAMSLEAGAAEKWADQRLPERDGLAVWLDASRQAAAAQAAGKPAPRDGAAIDIWFDGSGNALHVSAASAAARPQFLLAGDAALIRFDGEANCLSRAAAGRAFRSMTVFLVASPHSNSGGFRGLLACNQDGKNDYTSGFTIDQNFAFTSRFEALNVEGAGFGGARNLLNEPAAFGRLRSLAVTSQVGAGGVKLFADGRPQASRDRSDSVIRMDRLVVGARCYSNESATPYIQGFFEGDLAEVIVYDRVLPEAQRTAVEKYLREKYAHVVPPPLATAAGAKRLVTIADPPALQVFVPGFTVRELPVKLTNINNVRYRADGKLVALAYNGNVYLLSDTDGDGLEDHADLFWDNQGRIQAPIGMALTPPGYPAGNGVFVACKGKVSLIVDTSGAGAKADKEIVVATGRKPLAHNVDALGVAIDPKDASIYFGLGTADFTNPYLIDPSGKSHYDLNDPRGTIMRVSPDFKTKEIYCTGIRFSVGMGFNPAGDLFATDQEGATWLANGNPLDELLHIQKGRHYGFPPRHPRYLPGVIDEPSVFDYGPQHQSTCGLVFNVPVNGGPIFGPGFWAGDALVTGYSRAKLFRTKLAKTPAGYVAQNQLLACARMLVVDSCVSPGGDLIVAMHGGAPDWGNGPNGKGKLFKITYADRARPQPVLAWAAAPGEVRVAFDRPIDPSLLRGLAANTSIEYGAAVSAGDRFETIRPGYAVVQRQQRSPRYDLPVLGAGVTSDRRTLIFTTRPHPAAATYAITLPGMGRPAASDSKDGLRQVPAIDLAYDLGGVEATWRPDDGKSPWAGWLPHLDLSVANAFTASSADHDVLRSAVQSPGELRLATQLDLVDMLRPAVQPGSKIDYQWPAEHVTLTFISPQKLTVTTPAGPVTADVDPKGRHRATVTIDPKSGELAPLQIVLYHAGGAWPELAVSYHTAEDPRPRALPLHRLRVPWATAHAAVVIDGSPRQVPQLEGGNWARGRTVFNSEEAMCVKCHRFEGRGGSIGPDLSNLYQRDYDSVLKDIINPSAAINPDYIAYTITLVDGNVLAGVIREAGGGKVIIGQPGGKEDTIDRARIKQMEALPTSIMPHGLDGVLGPEKMKDLLTFLLAEPMAPAPIEAGGVPPARTRAEIQAILGAATTKPTAKSPKPLHVVLAWGPKDHGPGEHDYPLWRRRWERLLATAEGVDVQSVNNWLEPAHFQTADVIVFYSDNPGFTAQRDAELDAYLKRGGGLVYLHYAVDGHDAPDALARSIGLAWRGGASKFRHGALKIQFTDPDNPITHGFKTLDLFDESYWDLVGDPSQIHVLGQGDEEGKPRPLFWTRESGPGRVFVSIPGHFTWTFDDPLFRILILRGIAWTAHEPVDRLADLATIGARITDP